MHSVQRYLGGKRLLLLLMVALVSLILALAILPAPTFAQSAEPEAVVQPTDDPGSSGYMANCPSSTKPGWKLVFCDEFNDPVFSVNHFGDRTGKWMTQGFEGGTHGDQLQYYTRFNKEFPTTCDKGGINHIQSGGTLKIITKKEPGNYEVWHWDKNDKFYKTCEPFTYTSGFIQTPGKFLYGYFEIRAKIPNQGLVLWPAFWLYAEGLSGDKHF
jgi:beta-glucanase (GH16 family)